MYEAMESLRTIAGLAFWLVICIIAIGGLINLIFTLIKRAKENRDGRE